MIRVRFAGQVALSSDMVVVSSQTNRGQMWLQFEGPANCQVGEQIAGSATLLDVLYDRFAGQGSSFCLVLENVELEGDEQER